jgi:hypothetical protein
MTQEQPHAPENPPLLNGASATTSIEEVVHREMSLLAKRFHDLLNDVSSARLMRQMRIKHCQGVVMHEAKVFSGPTTREGSGDTAHPGMIVRVYAEETGQAFPPGNLWYRISKPSAPPRYIAAGLVIRDNLHQLLQDYFQLAIQVWEAAAADRLEDIADKFYCKGGSHDTEVDKLGRKLAKFEELCHNIKQIPHPRKGRRGKRRVRLYQHALKAWQDNCLGKDAGSMLPDPTRCGRILYRVRGYLGLASCNGFDYVLIKGLQWLSVLITLFSLLAPINLIRENQASLTWLGFPQTSAGNAITITIVVSLFFLLTPAYLLWFSFRRTSLSVLIGYALAGRGIPGAVKSGRKVHFQILSTFQSFFDTCTHIPNILWNISLHLLCYWLRVWSVLGGAFLLLILYFSVVSPPDAPWILFEAELFYIICIPICFLIIFPFTLTIQAQMWGELITHTQRPPKARRSVVGPTIKLLSFHTICFLVIALLVLNLVPPFNNPSASPITLGSLPFNPLHLVVYLLVVALPYLLLLELPYRWGLRCWKNHQLDDLANRRKGVDKRLSRTLLTAVIEKELSLEDYVLWQLYRTQEEDIKKTLPGPFSLVQRGSALLLSLSSSYLIGTAISLLPHLPKLKLPWN